ncbi:MAG: hypothetical protein ACFCUN_04815, partial [Hyphomicrobiaceae bacterium]
MRLATQVRAHLAADDVGRLTHAVAKLSQDSRLIVFFGSGRSSQTNQAIAQVAGWNIPGVGEPAQKLRPRTRIYSTCDPDTLRQLAQSLDFTRTALVFAPDSHVPQTTLTQARALMPACLGALGPAAGERIVCLAPHGQGIGPAVGATAELISQIERVGGQIVPVLEPGFGLSAAQLMVGIARGVDVAAVQAGALAKLAAMRTELTGEIGDDDAPSPHGPDGHAADVDAQAALVWQAYLGARLAIDAACRRVTAVQVMSASDRMARGAQWYRSQLMSADAGLFVGVEAQPVLGEDLAVLGLGGCEPRSTSVPIVLIDSMLALADESAGWIAQVLDAACSCERLVRRLTVDPDDMASVGAFFAGGLIDAALLPVARAAADRALET